MDDELTPFCESVLKELMEEKLGTDEFTYTKESGSVSGDNYIGIIYRILGKRNDDSDRTFSVIVKVAPLNLTRREQFIVRPSFLREIWMYDDVMEMFRSYQERKGIRSDVNGLYEVAKCYRTIKDEMTESLFFEDLQVTGFELFNRHLDIELEHAMLVMKVLGKFHALSLAIKSEHPDLFEDKKNIEDLLTSRKDDAFFISYTNDVMQRAIQSVDADTDPNIRRRLEILSKETLIQILSNSSDGRKAEPYSVICHGDCWNNNILYKTKNGKPNEIRLLDWQLSRYASPANDLTHFLFLCANKDVRKEHYHHLIKTYHESLSDMLKLLGLNSDDLFPYSALLDQLKQFGRFGLAMCMLALPVITMAKSEVPDLNVMAENYVSSEGKVNIFLDANSAQNVYNSKMSSAIVDMVRYGYI